MSVVRAQEESMQSLICRIFGIASLVVASSVTGFASVHTWQKQELAFTSSRSFGNPYTDVTVWVDLKGPGFSKRIYGFWDGERSFKVRLLATAPGTWTWTSGSEPQDSGLAGKTGSFVASEWSEQEKRQNPLRRGFLRATQ